MKQIRKFELTEEDIKNPLRRKTLEAWNKWVDVQQDKAISEESK